MLISKINTVYSFNNHLSESSGSKINFGSRPEGLGNLLHKADMVNTILAKWYKLTPEEQRLLGQYENNIERLKSEAKSVGLSSAGNFKDILKRLHLYERLRIKAEKLGINVENVIFNDLSELVSKKILVAARILNINPKEKKLPEIVFSAINEAKKLGIYTTEISFEEVLKQLKIDRDLRQIAAKLCINIDKISFYELPNFLAREITKAAKILGIRDVNENTLEVLKAMDEAKHRSIPIKELELPDIMKSLKTDRNLRKFAAQINLDIRGKDHYDLLLELEPMIFTFGKQLGLNTSSMDFDTILQEILNNAARQRTQTNTPKFIYLELERARNRFYELAQKLADAYEVKLPSTNEYPQENDLVNRIQRKLARKCHPDVTGYHNKDYSEFNSVCTALKGLLSPFQN